LIAGATTGRPGTSLSPPRSTLQPELSRFVIPEFLSGIQRNEGETIDGPDFVNLRAFVMIKVASKSINIMTSAPLDICVLIRGGGEMASGIAHRLHQCHMRVLMTEIAAPTAVRRTVAFAEAIYRGCHAIEGVKSRRVSTVDEAQKLWAGGILPIFVDPGATVRREVKPAVIVDAIMAKKVGNTAISDAPLVVGVGPGFTAGENAHAVIESNRGYHLGRVIWHGAAEPDTGVPAPVAGYTASRVLRAPRNGAFKAIREIGDIVEEGEIVAEVDGMPIAAGVSGVIRGMLHDGVQVEAGMKLGDVDPRGEREYCYTISDKARAIGGGVVEAILHSCQRFKHPAT
jgi:xanthine dehydrogenase accessory factor